MNNINNALNKFLAEQEQVVTDPKTGKTYVKTKDGLIERTLIEKKLMVEDGRELLREETPISFSKRVL